ncbi:hypothetical protein [Nannocystis sp. SCPEA4]|uniref:hypothetical protein n=1 Tax=Nannocystis sp. SCPEA4 TaxID=2996787 RepID=UPI0022715842|nr:hypothetical protein [Nannocystis sp. SCPEA4]MCY1056320.1 hypothetical protein [Nannocystis sp. SCPEA4]
MKARADRRRGDGERAGDLRRALVLEESTHDQLPVLERELLQLGEEHAEQFQAQQLSVGLGGGRRRGRCSLLAPLASTIRAALHAKTVAKDRRQPWAQRLVAAGRRVRPCGHERVLHEVGGILDVSYESGGQALQPLQVREGGGGHSRGGHHSLPTCRRAGERCKGEA